MRSPWPVWIVVTVGALLSLSIGLLGLLAPTNLFAVLGHGGEPITDLTRQLAAYVGARELVIGVALVALLLRRSPALPIVMILFAASNALDSIDALAFHRWAQLPGAVLFAIAFFAAALWLTRRPQARRA